MLAVLQRPTGNPPPGVWPAALGKTLNLSIVAEGIETEAQQEFLTGIGCSILQGFLLGRPMPAEVLMETLRAAEEKEAETRQQIRWLGRDMMGLQAVPQLQ